MVVICKTKVNSKAFAIPILTAMYIIKADAVRIGIANALELTFVLCITTIVLNLVSMVS